jgi:hypothetical protein
MKKKQLNHIYLFLIFAISSFSLISKSNYEVLISPNYLNFNIYPSGLIIAYTNDDFENRTGNVFKYDKLKFDNLSKITTFENGIIACVNKDGDQMFINQELKTFSKTITMTTFRGKADGFSTYINDSFRIVPLDLNFNEIKPPKNYDDTKYKISNYLGYGNWHVILNGLSEDEEVEAETSYCGLLTKNGVKIEPKQGQFFHPFINGVSVVNLYGTKFGFINMNGDYLIDTVLTEYDYTQDMEQGITNYIQDGKKGFIFNKGLNVTKPIYDLDRIPLKMNNCYFITKDKKMGVFNKDGEIIVPFEHNDILLASQAATGFFIFQDGYKFGFKNETGKVVIKPEYKYVYPFSGKYSIVTNDGSKMGVIDRNGTLLVPFEFDKITYSDVENIFVFKKNEKFGVFKINE